MAITAEQAAQLASTYQAGDTSGLQGLVNQMGVTQADVAQYFPGFDVAAAGLNVPAMNQQQVQDLVTQAYGTIGRSGIGESSTAIDPTGYNYWTGQLQSGAMTPEQFQAAFSYAAAPAVVSQAYQNVLGREADVPGAEYYTQQLQSGALTADKLKEALAYGAQGLEDRLKAQVALGKDIFAPAEFLKGTSGMGYEDIVNYITANVSDPVRVAQAAARYGVDPNEILQAYQGKSPYSLQQIQDYLAQGKAGLGTRIQDIIGSTIGDADLISTIEGALPKGTSLLSGFTPTSLANKSIEEIERLIAESPTNKLQEAGRIRGLAENVFGMTSDQARKLASDLYTGKDTDDFAEGIYKDLLTKGFTKDIQNEVLLNAAKTNPNSKFFQDNPDAYLIYSPLKEKTGSTGQYDYFKNAPILNAKWAIENMGEKNQIIPHLGQDSEFGWMTNSRYAETLARGPALYGVEFNNRNDIEKAIDFERRIKDGTIINDPEGGYYDTVKNIGIEAPKSDNERKGYNPYSSDTLATLQDAARKAGLNPANYRSAGDLFDALEDKTKNIYQVVGRAINWKPEAAQNLGITQTTSGRGGVNHANVLYEKIGDKLIPVNAKAFEFHDPNTSRGFFGDLFGGIASIPFVAEIASVATGGNPLVYAALKGAQTMALGGDLEDAFKSAGLAYLSSYVIPKQITPNIQMALAQNSLISSLAQSSPELANLIIDGGTRAVVSSGLATITGQDPEKAALNSLVQSGLGTLTKEGLKLTNIPQEYQSIVANILSSAVLGQDPTKSLTGAATNILKNELKDFGREMIKSDQGSNRTKETKI